MVTAERLREILLYDPGSGLFTWRISHPNAPAGSIAGRQHYRGYIEIRIDKRLYLAHRLAWLYHHSEWPTEVIDHIDGNRANNRIANLRAVSQKLNTLNRPGPNHRREEWLERERKRYAQIRSELERK